MDSPLFLNYFVIQRDFHTIEKNTRTPFLKKKIGLELCILGGIRFFDDIFKILQA